MSKITLTFESEKLTEEELREGLLAWAESILKPPYFGDCKVAEIQQEGSAIPSRLEHPFYVAPRKLDHADSLGSVVVQSPATESGSFVPPRIGKVRVWKMNEEEWWAAVGTAEEVLADYMRITGVSREDATGEEDGLPALVSDEAMELMKFQDGGGKTFREELAAMITAGHKFPCLFAASSG
jgi:hypothetical protein